MFSFVLTSVLAGKQVTPAQTFMLLSFLNTLRTSLLWWMTSGILMLLESFVSLKRIEKILYMENLSFVENDEGRGITQIECKSKTTGDSGLPVFVRYSVQCPVQSLQNSVLPVTFGDQEYEENLKLSQDIRRKLVVSNLTCKVTNAVEQNTLENVSFEAANKSLTVITGKVGSGKTTLLASIVGEIDTSNGTITYMGTAAYVSQTAWVFSGTVQENILFGEAFNDNKFAKVIEACALKEDLHKLSNGVLTFVGERGVVLSGGQRARVSLARAVYANADMYVLDDPLCAVDVKVGEHIFNKCIRQLLKEKITVMVTYDEKYMKLADQIIVLDNGRVLGKGIYSELKRAGVLSSVLDASYTKHDETSEEIREGKEKAENVSLKDNVLTEHLELSEEDRAVGFISSRLYWDYFRAAMHPIAMSLVFAVLILSQGQYPHI